MNDILCGRSVAEWEALPQAERDRLFMEDLNSGKSQKLTGSGRRATATSSINRLAGSEQSAQTAPTVTLVRGSTVTPAPISWLWPGYLARGKMHVLAGAPGTGKTTIALRLGAIITTGGKWPDGSRSPVGNVIIWSGEDDIKDTLVPRLTAAGADMDRIFFVGGVRQGPDIISFDPAKHVPALVDAITLAGGASLVIIDPIVSAIAGDGHKSNDVRRGLQPLVDMATKAGCALLGITHFSKGTGGRDPVERVTGSVAFGALARIVLVAAKEQSNDASDASPRRVFMRAKSNIGGDTDGFEYSLEQRLVANVPDMFASVATFGQAVTGDARSVLGETEATPESERGALVEASEWLLDFLADGPRSQKAIQSAALESGYSWATIRRAKKKLGVKPSKSSMTGCWDWTLPEGAQDTPKLLTHESVSTLSAFGKFEHLQSAKSPDNFVEVIL